MTAAVLAVEPFLQFICKVCGLIYDEALGDLDSGLAPGTRFQDIPEDWYCPICAVGKADFEPWTPPIPRAPQTAVPAMSLRRDDAGVVIVGAGRAGWQVAQSLRERDATLAITLVSACAGDVYDKPQLSVAVARGLAVDALVREPAAAAAQRLQVRLLCDTAAVRIEAGTRTLRTARGPLRWRALVLAHGAEPALPSVLPPALVWRINDLASYTRLRAALHGGPKRITLIGAGLVGCELANDLALAGHRVTLLDVQPRPLAAQLPAAAGQRLLRAWAALPIRFVGGAQVSGVQRNGDGSLTVEIVGQGRHAADHVIAATGLRTAGRLARSAGLDFDAAAGGITVDADTGATSVAGIYALGDCCVLRGRASRYIEPIARQARAVARAITGAAVETAGDAAQEVLRVKTSALPITVMGRPGGDGHWLTERDDAQALLMRFVGRDGELLSTLRTGALPVAA